VENTEDDLMRIEGVVDLIEGRKIKIKIINGYAKDG